MACFERLLSAAWTAGPSRKGTCPGCHPGRWGCWGHLDAGLSVSLAGAHTAGEQRQGHGTRFSPGPAAPWDVWPDSPSDLGLCVSISAELAMTPVPRRTPCPDGDTGRGRGCSGTELNKSLRLRGLAGKGGPGLEPAHISHSPRGSRETEAQRPMFLKVLPVAWVGLGLDQR